jgi:hypothetical protein
MVAAGNDILEMNPILRASQGPWFYSKKLDRNLQGLRRGAEHCVVQQIFFRLVGILARSSPAGNAYTTLFFAASNFFKTSRALSSDRCFAIAAGVVQQLFFVAPASR